MTISAVYDAVDARGVALLLARSANSYLNNEREANRERAMNNVYRLLESYRSKAPFRYDVMARQTPVGPLDGVTFTPPAERNLSDVREAMEIAFEKIFQGVDSEVAINTVESVLRQVAYPAEHPAPSKADRDKAVAFFDSLIENLYSI